MMLLAWAWFSVTDTAVKWLVIAGLPAVQMAFMRYAVSFVLSLATGLWRGSFFEVADRATLRLVLLRGLFLALSTVLNFIALQHLPLSVTSALINSSPIIVTALAAPILGEKVGPWRWAAVIAGFAGVLTVIRPFGEDFHWAAFLVIGSATAIAVFSLMTRNMAGRISIQTMQFFVGGVGMVVLLPPALLSWTTPATLLEWSLFALLGFSAWFGHEIFSRAHSYADSNLLMPFTYSFILYLTAAGFLVFGAVPDTATLAGAAIIVASGLVIWWRESRR